MIELRWVVRVVFAGNPEGEKVLQYRQKQGKNLWDEPIWGEWKDVPVVKEGD